jgi:hypothetical protein
LKTWSPNVFTTRNGEVHGRSFPASTAQLARAAFRAMVNANDAVVPTADLPGPLLIEGAVGATVSTRQVALAAGNTRPGRESRRTANECLPWRRRV